MRRVLVAGAVLVAVSVAGPHLTVVARQTGSPSAQPSRALLNQYCGSCDNDRSKAGGLALDATHPIGDDVETWERALVKLRAHAMPPAGSRRPDDREYDRLV